MKIAVRYYTRGGATEKVGKAIAEALGVKGETIDRPLDEKVDLLFIGSGVYKGKIDPRMKKWLENLDPSKAEKAIFFSTSLFSGGDSDEQVRHILTAKGIPMDNRTFHCHGRFLFFYRNHPDSQDLMEAAIFAKNMAKK